MIPTNPDWNWSNETDYTLDMVEPYVWGTVLDFGCGLGRLTRAIATLNPHWKVIGYDPDAEAIDWASQRPSANAVYTTELPEDFDSVFSVLVFQHLSDTEIRSAINRLWPADLRFQWVAYAESGPLSYPRTENEMRELCYPYHLEIEADPVHEEWRWATTR